MGYPFFGCCDQFYCTLSWVSTKQESGYFGQDAPSEKDPSYFKARSLGLESFTKNLAVVAAS